MPPPLECVPSSFISSPTPDGSGLMSRATEILLVKQVHPLLQQYATVPQMQSWEIRRLPFLDIQSRDAQVVAFGAVTFTAGFLAGLVFARAGRSVATRDAAVNTEAEQPAATPMNGHISEPDTISQASTPRSMVNAESEHATPRPASCKMLIIVRPDLLTVRQQHAAGSPRSLPSERCCAHAG